MRHCSRWHESCHREQLHENMLNYGLLKTPPRHAPCFTATSCSKYYGRKMSAEHPNEFLSDTFSTDLFPATSDLFPSSLPELTYPPPNDSPVTSPVAPLPQTSETLSPQLIPAIAPAYQIPASELSNPFVGGSEGPTMAIPNESQSPPISYQYADEAQCLPPTRELSFQAAREGIATTSRNVLRWHPDTCNIFNERRGTLLRQAEASRVPFDPPANFAQVQTHPYLPHETQVLISQASPHTTAHASPAIPPPHMIAPEQGRVPPEVLHAAHRTFESCDAGQCGSLDFKHFLDALEMLSINLPYHHALTCFAKSSTDQDGRLSKSEFINAYLRILCFSPNSCHLRRYV